MTTASGSLSSPDVSVTNNEKFRSPTATGAVKVGFCAVELDRLTASGLPGRIGVPAALVCTHWYVSAVPSGSDDADPSSVTTLPRPGVWSGPAFAIGRWLNPTLIETKAGVLTAPNASVTTSRNRNVVPVGVPGAVKVGFCAVALESVTVGLIGLPAPSTCVHAYVIAWLSGSVEADPSRVTVAFGWMPVWFGPASAVGVPLAFTAMSTVSAVLTAPN